MIFEFAVRLKYIKDLEAAGFERNQAEAQVQMVLDAIEGDLVTKADFSVFQERIDNRLTQHEQRINARFDHVEQRINARFERVEQRFERRFLESEFRMLSRLGLLVVSSTTIAVAILTWLIKT